MKTKNTLKTAAGIVALVLTCMLATGTAWAQTPVDTGTKTFADCTIRAQITTDPMGDAWGSLKVRARGQLVCQKRHPKVTMTVQLKRFGYVVHQYKVPTMDNWKGTGTDRWYQTDWFQLHYLDGSVPYQAVVTVTLSDVGSSYVTTGIPISLNA